MHQRIANLNVLTESLRPFLGEYLTEHGYSIDTNFECINPKHNDTNASMSASGVRNGIYKAHCFGCGTTVDIFSAAHFIEGKAIKGPGFIEENVKPLAERYGISIELEDLTADEIYEYKTYEAYKYAAELISDRSFGDYTLVDKEIERRKWDPNKCAKWGVGTVNFEEFKKQMRAAGYEPSFLSGVDLERSNLFDSHNMLFTIYDDYGRPVGFSARNLKHDGTKENGSKYINTRGTGLECAIFKKGERLYNLHVAKNAPSPLFIFEGQADVITARHQGLESCCCILGSEVTDHHINLLKRHAMFNIVLVFDSDGAGHKATIKAIDDKFAHEKDFRVKLVQIPNGQDPDELLREKGIDEFVRLRKITAFEWRLMQFTNEVGDDISEDSKSEIANKMVPLIVSEKNLLKQEDMAKQVQKYTGYSLQTLMSEVKRLRYEKESMIQEKKKAAIESLLSEVRYNPDDAELALAQCQSVINDINKESSDHSTGKGLIDFVLSQKEIDENRTEDFAGYKMRPEGLGNIAMHLDDDWTTGSLVYVGGSEQSGKTTFCTQMAYEIATCNDNVICIYHSIDDAAKFIVYKWVCQAANDLFLELNHISNPNYWARQGYNIKDIREEAYKKIIGLMQDQKLIVSDATSGSSLAYAESMAKRYRENYPDKKIVLFIDNFHKLPDFGEMSGHERPKRISNHLKNMTVANDITIVSTVEYKKLEPGEKPTNQSIAETRSLAYDATVIIHLFNQLHHCSDEDEAVLVHEYNGKMLPRIWCKFGKNKVSGFEGREFLNLYPANATMRSIDLDTAVREQKERKALLNNKNYDVD